MPERRSIGSAPSRKMRSNSSRPPDTSLYVRTSRTVPASLAKGSMTAAYASSDSDEVVFECERGRRGPRRDAKLREDVLHVAGGRVLAERERRGDFAIALPGRDQPHNFQLARRQVLRIAFGVPWTAGEPGDVLGDVRGVPPHARQYIGGNRVLKDEPDEVQARQRPDNAPLVQRFAGLVESREVDPREVMVEAGAPDDVCHVEDATVLQQGQSVANAGDPRDALDSDGCEVLRLHPDQRRRARGELRTDLAPDRRPPRQYAVAEKPEHRQCEPGREASMANGDLTRGPSRERDRVRPRELEGNLGARVAQPDDEHAAFLQLRRVPVLARMHLHDARIELPREDGHLRNPVRARRDDDVVGLEAPVARVHDVPIADARDSLHADAGADRKIEPRGIRLEVVPHLVLRREGPTRRGKAHTRQ